jgi:hypothetical protein
MIAQLRSVDETKSPLNRLIQPFVQRQLRRSFPSIAEEFWIRRRTSGALYAVER